MTLSPNITWIISIAVGAIIGIPLVFHVWDVVQAFWSQF